MANTTRWGLPYPVSTDTPAGHTEIQALAVALDGVAFDDQGTLANRPVSTGGSPGKKGRYYFVTGDGTPVNNGVLWRDNGTGWDRVSGFSKTTISAWSGGPPGSPGDGDIWIATGVDGGGLRLQFQYDAGSGSAYKWALIGGPPITAAVATAENLAASASYVNLGTTGPAIALGRGGDWIFDYSFQTNNDSPSNVTDWAWMAYALSGGTTYAATDADAAVTLVQAANFGALGGSGAVVGRLHTGIAAGTTITAKYHNTTFGSPTATLLNRRLKALPVRIA